MADLSRFLLIAAVLVAGTAHAGPKLDQEAWFDFKFKDSKVGYLFSKDEATSINDRPAIHSKRWSVITVCRQEQIVRMESTTDAWSDLEGKPMRYKHTRVEGQETRSSEGYRDGNTFVIRHDVGGNLNERKIPLDTQVYLSSSIEAIFYTSLKVGKELKGKTLVEEDGEVKDFSIKVLGTEKGTKGEAFLVEETVAGVVSLNTVYADGRAERIRMPKLGAEFVATTREKAVQVEPCVDIFSKALFSIPDPLPPQGSIEELVVKLRGRSGVVPTHIADARQKTKPLAKDSIEMRIGTQEPPVKPPRLPITTPSMKKFLSETPYEAIRDEVLVSTAKRVVGDEKNAWEAAKKLNAFVHRHIEQKTLSRAFASANEALATKEGDCSEHAVLFSALAKIVGIPTRLATGVVYVGGERNQFGYHEWAEVWMGDRWIGIDPTFGQDLADPTHIKFAQGLSDPDGLRDAGVVAAGLIGDLELTVLEYTMDDGRKVKLAGK